MDLALDRPIPIHDPAKSLLHNDHFQIGYITNDIERAAGVFRERFGVAQFSANDDTMANGATIRVRSVWIGAMMFELFSGSGPDMAFYTDAAPPGGDFVLRFHHFGYLVPDDAGWEALERQLAAGGWAVHRRSDIPDFLRVCMVEAPELGHFLEFIQPRAGLIDASTRRRWHSRYASSSMSQ